MLGGRTHPGFRSRGLPRCIDQGVDLMSSARPDLRVAVSLQSAAADTVGSQTAAKSHYPLPHNRSESLACHARNQPRCRCRAIRSRQEQGCFFACRTWRAQRIRPPLCVFRGEVLLEQLTKEYPARLIVSDSMMAALGAIATLGRDKIPRTVDTAMPDKT
jgi:hypothetical protein